MPLIRIQRSGGVVIEGREAGHVSPMQAAILLVLAASRGTPVNDLTLYEASRPWGEAGDPVQVLRVMVKRLRHVVGQNLIRRARGRGYYMAGGWTVSAVPDAPLVVRVPGDLHGPLLDVAEARGVSIEAVVETLIREGLHGRA